MRTSNPLAVLILCVSFCYTLLADRVVSGSADFTNEFTPMTESWTFNAGEDSPAVVRIFNRIQQGKSITLNANVELTAAAHCKNATTMGNMIFDGGGNLTIAETSKFTTGFDAGLFAGTTIFTSGGTRMTNTKSTINGAFVVNGYRWNPANGEWDADNYCVYLRNGKWTFGAGARMEQNGVSVADLSAVRALNKIENTTLNVKSAEGSLRFDEILVFDNSVLNLKSRNAIIAGAKFGASSQGDSVFELRNASGGTKLTIRASAANEIGTIRYADGASLYLDVSALDGKTADKAALSIARLVPISEGANIKIYVDFGGEARGNLSIGNVKSLLTEGGAEIYFKKADGYQLGALGVNMQVGSNGTLAWANSGDAVADKSSRSAQIRITRTSGATEVSRVQLEVSPDDPSAWRYRIPKEQLTADGDIATVDVVFNTAQAVNGERGYFVLGDSRIGTFRLMKGSLKDCARTVMPVFGMKNPRETWVAIVKGLRYEYDIKVEVSNGVYEIFPRFKIADIGMQKLGLAHSQEDLIVDFYPLADTAEYCDMGRVYRNYQLARGEVKPLKERIKNNPRLKYSAESIFFRKRFGEKNNSAQIEHQVRGENEPPLRANATFDDFGAMLTRLNELGVDKVEACFVGWGVGGFEGDYPDLTPVPTEFGGEEALIRNINLAKSLGYQVTGHINHMDYFTIADKFDWADITKDKNGNYVKTAIYWNGRAYTPCFRRIFEKEKYMKADCEYMQSIGFNGILHVDVTSCVRPHDCFNSDHPCTRNDTADWMNKIGKMFGEYFAGFSSEGPCDHVAKSLDYVLYTSAWPSYVGKQEALVDGIVPFWQSVYHGIILSNPFYATIDYPHEHGVGSDITPYSALGSVANQRLKVFEYGGRPTYYFRMSRSDATRDEALVPVAEAYKEYAPTAYLQYEYIESHREISSGVFVTGYSDGSEVITNYNDTPFSYAGRTVGAKDFLLLNPRSVSIDAQSRVVAGAQFTLKAVCDVAGATYRWYKNGVLIEGEMSDTLTISQTESSAVYKVEVEKNGNVYASNDWTISVGNPRLFVSKSGAAGNDGLSWATALPDLKSALARADFANCVPEIWVAAGTYALEETASVSSSVRILGGFAGTEASPDDRPLSGSDTVLFGGGERRIIEASQKCGVLAFDRVWFASASSSESGGAVYSLAAENAFTNCRFVQNASAKNGGAAAFAGGAVSFKNCDFFGNTAASGGAVNADSSAVVLANATFRQNSATQQGGAVSFFDSQTTVVHATFSGNSAGTSGGAVSASGGTLAAVNSIFWDDSAPSDSEISVSDAAAEVSNSVVAGGFEGGSAITSANPNLGEFKRRQFSAVYTMLPAAGASADGLAAQDARAPNFDANLVARTFPCFAGAAQAAGIAVSVSTPTAGETFVLSVAEVSGATYKWFKNGTEIAGATSATLEVSQTEADAQYECKIFDASGALLSALATSVGTKPVSVVYVSPDGNDSADGLSWRNAKATLKAALAALPATPIEGSVVKMASGEYPIAAAVAVSKPNVQVVGGFSPATDEGVPTSVPTVLDGGSAARILSVSAAAEFENLVLRNASADSGAAALVSADAVFKRCKFVSNASVWNGAAVQVAAGAPVFENCEFENNTATFAGGAVYMKGAGAVVFKSCLFAGNKAKIGSAVICNATDAVFANCTFTDNATTDGNTATHCIEITNSASPVFDSCTLLGGAGAQSCAVIAGSSSTPKFYNSILWNWKNSASSAITLSGGAAATVENCVVDTGFAGGKNVYTSDPELGALTDLGGTRVVPIGYNGSAAWTGRAFESSPATDAAGNARSANRCIGAFEITKNLAFTLQPRNANAFVGKSASFAAEVESDGECSLQWEKSSDGGATWTPVDGANSATFSIESAALTDAGLYRCSATLEGSVAHSFAATLSVGDPVSVVSEPSAATTEVGGSATFSVSATGSNLQYQWQIMLANGVWTDIEGATDSALTLSDIPSEYNGAFVRCRIYNSAVSAYSFAASLAVSNSPTISGYAVASEMSITGFITLENGAYFYVDEDTNLSSIRAMKDAVAEVNIADGAKVVLTNENNYAFGSTIASQNKGSVLISGGGTLSMTGATGDVFIRNMNLDLRVPTTSDFSSFNAANANIRFGANWTGARMIGGHDSAITIENGVVYKCTGTYFNLYASSSVLNIGEPSETLLVGDARAKLVMGEDTDSAAALYAAGKSYINGVVYLRGQMNEINSGQYCAMFIASCQIGESAWIDQLSSAPQFPVIVGSPTFAADGTSGIVSNAATDSLCFGSRLFITDGATLRLNSTDAFRIGRVDNSYNRQRKSVFTVSNFTAANMKKSGEVVYEDAFGAANAKLVLGAENNFGAFEFFPNSTLEITLNGNKINVGKFALMPESESGTFTLKINDFQAGLVRISAMTAAQIGALNIVDSEGNPIDYTLVPVSEFTATDFVLGGAVSITDSPKNAVILDGDTATFFVGAAGSAERTYQWQVSTDGGATWQNIDSATSAKYSFNASAAQCGYLYRCVVSGGGETAVSDAARLAAFGTATVYVSPEGDNSDGASWQTAFNTLAAAVASAPDGARIFVKAGTFTTSRIVIEKNLEIIGGFAGYEIAAESRSGGETVVSGGGTASPLLVRNCTVLLRSLTVAETSQSASINAVNSNLFLRNVRIRDARNPTGNGGAIYAYSGSYIDVLDSEFENCSAGWAGGALFLRDASGRVVRTYFGNCNADNVSGLIHLAGGNLYMENTTAFNCSQHSEKTPTISAAENSATQTHSTFVANLCTFAQNGITQRTLVGVSAESSARVLNSIVWSDDGVLSAGKSVEVSNCVLNEATGENVSTANPNLSAPAYAADSPVRTMEVGEGSSAIGLASIPNALSDAAGRARAMPLCTAGAAEYAVQSLVLQNGAYVRVDGNRTAASAYTEVNGAAAEVNVSRGSQLVLSSANSGAAGTFGCALGQPDASLHGSILFSGDGTLKLTSTDSFIKNVSVDFDIDVDAPASGLQLENAELFISKSWRGARLLKGLNSTITVRNGAEMICNKAYFNFYVPSSAINIGEPSETPLSGAARARFITGTSAGGSSSMLCLGNTYINGYVEVNGRMATGLGTSGAQFCTVKFVSAVFDKYAEVEQNCSVAGFPAVLGGLAAEGAGAVSSAAEGALRFDSRVFVADGATLELRSTDAFSIASDGGTPLPQAQSTFTISAFDPTKVAATDSGYDTSAALGAANAKLVLGADNNFGAFEFFQNSTLEITLGGHCLNVGKFALMPEVSEGTFTLKFNDFAANLVRISGMTAAEIRALDIVDAQGNPLVYTLTPAEENSETDFYLSATVGILKSPANAVARAGENAVFSVLSDGDGTYQWQKFENGVWVDIEGATSNTLEVSASAADNGARFRCAISKGGVKIATSSAEMVLLGSADVYVSADGDNSDGASWSGAYTSLSAAISRAPAGARIKVAGNLTIGERIGVSKNLEIEGGYEFGADAPTGVSVLDCGSSVAAFNVVNSAVLSLKNLEIRNTAGVPAIGVNASTLALEKCRFVNVNTTPSGGAIYAEQGSIVSVESCEFENCSTAYAGGAIFLRNSRGSINSVFIGLNSATTGGAAIYLKDSSLDMTNATIYGGTPAVLGNPRNAVQLIGSKARIDCGTFVQSAASANFFALVDVASELRLRNSIVWGNLAAAFDNSGVLDAKNCIVDTGCAGENISTQNPELSEPAYSGASFVRTMQVSADSVAVGAGVIADPMNDACSRPRRVPNCTVGAFEYMSDYSQWAVDGGIGDSPADYRAIPHSDGITNIEKYVFNLDASKAASYADNPNFSFVNDGTTAVLRFQKRTVLPEGVSVQAIYSTDLENWLPAEITVDSSGNGFDNCRVEMAPDDSGKIFIRLKIDIQE